MRIQYRRLMEMGRSNRITALDVRWMLFEDFDELRID